MDLLRCLANELSSFRSVDFLSYWAVERFRSLSQEAIELLSCWANELSSFRAFELVSDCAVKHRTGGLTICQVVKL